MTKIVYERPPIWDDAVKAFPAIENEAVIFAWGDTDTIYNPKGVRLADHFIDHERAHFVQQKAIGGSRAWWKRYIADVDYRVQCEVEAYGAQYRSFCRTERDRNRQAQFLDTIAGILASPIYGSPIAKSEARHLIQTTPPLPH